MKKRILAVLLLCAVLIGLLGLSAAAQELFFVAVNDTIPLTLSTAEKPHLTATGVYVPYTVFDAAPGGINEVMNAKEQTLLLYTKEKKLSIDIENSKSTDESGAVSDILMTYKNGYPFIPLAVVCEHFGLKYSVLTSKTGCTVLRFTTGSEVYDDETFLQKAENLIAYRIENNETSSHGGASQDGQNGNEDAPFEEKAAVYLALTDVSQAKDALDALSDRSASAAFFLTTDEINENPALVRQIYAEGHPLGLTVRADESDVSAALADANEALCTILHQKTLMVLLSSEQAQGLDCYRIFLKPAAYSAEQLAKLPEAQRFALCSQNLSGFLRELAAADCTVKPLKENSPIS